MEEGLDASRSLRGHVRDLAALVALPAMWRGRDPSYIAGSALDALRTLTDVDYASLRFEDPHGGPALEHAYVSDRLAAGDAAALEAAPDDGAETFVVHAPSAGPICVLRLRLELERERGVLLIASLRDAFPTDLESFLCRVAADQALNGVHAARLLQDYVEANRAKSRFLATMSHELRTPLNAVIGYADLMDAEIAGPLTRGQRGQLDRIKLGARHLIHLIEQILAFSRIEAGREEVNLQTADVAKLARETFRLTEPLAAQKQIALFCDTPDTLEVSTDVGMVRQILLNLLSNAIKFTARGVVRLAVNREGADLVLAVSDTGIGIAREDYERIFEPFSQIERGAALRPHGTGLGLAVSRQLARLLGGDVTIDGAPGQGSTFTVRLPIGGGAGQLPSAH